MAKTNLNVSPYFDDFDATKNFYKVLFKPGYPVQARELTTLQSILQDQISSLGKSIFKDGSVVIPGEVSYDPNYYAVKIQVCVTVFSGYGHPAISARTLMKCRIFRQIILRHYPVGLIFNFDEEILNSRGRMIIRDFFGTDVKKKKKMAEI